MSASVASAAAICAANLPAKFYKLRDGIPPEVLKTHYIAKNTHPVAIKIAEDIIERDDFDSVTNKFSFFHFISSNPAARELIEKCAEDDYLNNTFIDWYYVSANPCCVDLLEEYPKTRINWSQLCFNTSPNAIALVSQNRSRSICAYAIAQNPAATELIKKYHKRNPTTDYGDTRFPNIRFEYLAGNPNPEIFQYVKQEMRDFLRTADEEEVEIFWESLASNPSDEAVTFMLTEAPPDRINWRTVYRSSCPAAIDAIMRCKTKIFDPENTEYIVNYIACNQHIEVLGAVIDHLRCCYAYEGRYDKANKKREILIEMLAQNPAIFAYDYARMRAERADLHAELIAWYMSPARVAAFLENGGSIDDIDDM